jgi:hypothetical protein
MKWIGIGLALVIAVAIGAWWYEGYRAESALLRQPVYRVLEKHERALFDELVTEYRVYERGEENLDKFTNTAHEKINLAATQRLAHASPESVVALTRELLSIARKMQSAPGDACYRFWFPQVSGPPDFAGLLDAQTEARTFDLMAEVIRSSAETPAPLPDPEAVKDDLASVINATYQQFGTDAQMLANAEDPRADHSKVCAITISVYDRILGLPAARAADLLRAMTQLR